MKIRLSAVALCLLFCSSVFAIHAATLATNPARIEAARMTEVPLVLSEVKKGWIEIPLLLKTWSATIFKPDADQLGVARIKVLESGYLLLACNFDYQGNRSGDWTREVMSRNDFLKGGWKELEASRLGGELIQQDNRSQVIFYKQVQKGETFSLRCNKYDPPYPILLLHEHAVGVVWIRREPVGEEMPGHDPGQDEIERAQQLEKRGEEQPFLSLLQAARAEGALHDGLVGAPVVEVQQDHPGEEEKGNER
ncbi:MAG: hypothetical protein WD342_03775 [Verrucomicrobiales bacterium]